ncbi:MAG: TlpA disulfide reductase family protein [bacterium]
MISWWKMVCTIAGLILTAGCLDVSSSLPRVPRTGDMAPDFQAEMMGTGQVVSLEDFRGETVLVNIWATWCIPCRVETPFLQETYQKYEDKGLRILGISVDSPRSDDIIKKFLDDNSVTYDIALDPSMASTDVFSVVGLPASFLIGPDGIIVYNRIGPIAEKDPDFESALELALK